jgi:uncharacterized protein involved in outer membrane biogenesis
MKSAIAKLLRRTLYFLVLLLAILVILGSIFLSQLNLDDYRHELEQELSLALEQPVQLGRSKLTFNKGIALRFQNLQIGPPEALLAQVPRLTATLKIAPLLYGNIILDKVNVDSPTIQVWLPILNRPERGTTNRLTEQLGIRILKIHDASINVHQRKKSGAEEVSSFKNLNIELRGWRPDKTARLTISGQLQQSGQPAEFLIDMNLPVSSEPGAWRHETLDYRLSITNLAANLPKVITQNRNLTNVTLNSSVRGVPVDGADIVTTLTSSSQNKQLFSLTGRWTSHAEKESITALKGDLLGLPISGEFNLLREQQGQLLAGRLGAADIRLSRKQLEKLLIPGTENLQKGTLERLELALEKKWPAGQAIDGLPRIKAEVTLSNLEWTRNSPRQVQDLSAVLSLENQVLKIQKGLLVTGRQPISFTGRINSLFKRPDLDFRIDLQPLLGDLLTKDSLPAGWKLSGKVPASLRLKGAIKQPSYRFHADLTKALLSLGPFLNKPANKSASLLLAGAIDAEQVQLERLELQFPDLLITGGGSFAHDPASDYFLLDIDPFNLALLQPISPLLKKLQLEGALHPMLERDHEGLSTNLHLNNVAAHMNNIVGDLTKTNGDIRIDQDGLFFRNLKTVIGKSDFILNGKLADWQTAELDLRLRSSHVRAHDLIFPNRQLQLYDLDGHLQIDRNGINFKRVDVRLEQDTQVTVTGSLDNFKKPLVTLDIKAEKANVDQVIELFAGPRKTPPPDEKVAHKPLTITAKIKEGTIGSLRFQNAEGLIKDHRGVFTIYPLRFQSDKGFCLARIEFDRNHPDGLLKISGHAEELDASVLHQDLFKKRGLIIGSLRGDFYLEGSPRNGKFWHGATGGIHLQVKDGTLRKFRGLARVFSLLNVSQLFAGKLPDMDREGMPFSLLEGSLRIANGRAKTEDMRIKSVAMNMSLIGSQSLIEDSINYNLAVMPLRTVDKVITSIPIAGWVLAGEDKAFLTAHFKIEGSSDAPKVTAVPINTFSDTVFGIFKRTLGLPGKLVKDIGTILKQKPAKKKEPAN